ncbi:MAG: DUF4159 domain-containing protein [Proteobacteria bacterium]|nr:DUF4159 domain-containing protein [Pseudomonadota bacterium]
MTFFGILTFAEPFILAGLIVLPAIWFLLRVTPPSPRRVMFPPLRLLLGLSATEETPSRTPWWLLLLRLAAAALIILALAAPTIGEPPKPLSNGPLVLFVDNGWTAAHAWKDREAAISDALNGAARAGRPVALVPTANIRGSISLLDAGSAQRQAEELAPVSWLPDRKRAAAALAHMHFATRPEILWLSDGLDYGDAADIASKLSKLGATKILSDAPGHLPLALKPEVNRADGFTVTVIRAETQGARHGSISALGPRGENLASTPFAFASGKDQTTAKITLPLEVRNETARIVIDNEDSAGATRLLDSNEKRRAVGLISASNTENDQPLLSDLYYLERALSPFADVTKGSVNEALSRNASVLMLADIGRVAGADYTTISKFVEDGGVLVRFAGARMTQNVDDLIPVKLRSGGRYLGGALAWAEPQHLAPFPDASPFRGLAIPKEVTVSRQVLAEPTVDLGEHTWARLTDGTPLVTAAQRGKGWIVLFHVTAGPAWSSLPLSGLYVEMLHRVLDLASGARPSDMGTGANAMFPAYTVLDGFGHAIKPGADALPLRGAQLSKTKPSPLHPAGLYGSEGAQIALNAVDAKDVLIPFGNIGAQVENYSGTAAIALQPLLLSLALALLLIDAVVSLLLRGFGFDPKRLLARLGVLALALALFHPGNARADEAFDMKAALDTHLAYVITGVPDVDAMSAAGLKGLGAYLHARTSYDPKDPMGVNLDTDNLAFFPLLYWPMDPREKDLSPQALSKIADYMRNGGTILIDTRDLTLGPSRGQDNPGEQTLKRLLGKVDMPPLQPVPPDHVLRKTFYLLNDFPGRWEGGKVWVEALPPPDPDAGPSPARGGDNVSPVIIGGNDWAAAWAIDNEGRGLVAVSPGGDRQREMAVRFGINVVMYALTGNYKTDQVHVPALLQRTGK